MPVARSCYHNVQRNVRTPQTPFFPFYRYAPTHVYMNRLDSIRRRLRLLQLGLLLRLLLPCLE